MRTEYDLLFDEIFTMTTEEDFENAINHLHSNEFITESQFLELWEMACDIHQRFIA